MERDGWNKIGSPRVGERGDKRWYLRVVFRYAVARFCCHGAYNLVFLFSEALATFRSISITTSKMLEKFKFDKKNKNNQLTFILNKKIGVSFIKSNMDVSVLTNFLDEEI